MYDLSLEAVDARNVCIQGLLVVVVSGAGNQPLGPEDDCPRLSTDMAGNLYMQSPALLFAPPVGRQNTVVVPDLLVNAKRFGRLLQIAPDFVSPRNGVGRAPWIEWEAERVQIRVGAHAGVVELRPRAAELVAGFENGVFGVWQRLLQAVGGVDAADAAADDEDVKVRVDHGGLAGGRDCGRGVRSSAGV